MTNTYLMRIGETAKLIGISVATLTEWDEAGAGPPSVWINGRRRYRRSDVESWLVNLPTHRGDSPGSKVEQ